MWTCSLETLFKNTKTQKEENTYPSWLPVNPICTLYFLAKTGVGGGEGIVVLQEHQLPVECQLYSQLLASPTATPLFLFGKQWKTAQVLGPLAPRHPDMDLPSPSCCTLLESEPAYRFLSLFCFFFFSATLPFKWINHLFKLYFKI